MGDSLQSSIWAPGNRGVFKNSHNNHSGDWACLSCSFSNYKWRTKCFQCSSPKSTDIPTINGHTTLASSWDAEQSSNIRPDHSLRGLQTENCPGNVPGFKPVENGLATSRWAPRRQSRGEPVQIWTRTVSAAKPSRPSSPSKVASKSNGTPDMGLPYQVQHYILALIQRILEEGCYDFASRWLPQTLKDKGWDCSEAVELSTWKAFLPDALPPTAIKPLSNYTLDAALVDAVRIRNSAVHRHLCDNDELRKMTLQAQDLMSMFSDTTRQNKFHQLWTELNMWSSASDQSGARIRLEGALREISERPMDDMDWTPNAVSLEELPIGSENIQYTPGHYADEMELD